MKKIVTIILSIAAANSVAADRNHPKFPDTATAISWLQEATSVLVDGFAGLGSYATSCCRTARYQAQVVWHRYHNVSDQDQLARDNETKSCVALKPEALPEWLAGDLQQKIVAINGQTFFISNKTVDELHDKCVQYYNNSQRHLYIPLRDDLHKVRNGVLGHPAFTPAVGAVFVHQLLRYIGGSRSLFAPVANTVLPVTRILGWGGAVLMTGFVVKGLYDAAQWRMKYNHALTKNAEVQQNLSLITSLSQLPKRDVAIGAELSPKGIPKDYGCIVLPNQQ